MDLVCNGRGPQPLASILDTSLLKVKRLPCTRNIIALRVHLGCPMQHRQRDDIEEALQGYAEGAPFDIGTLRDQR